MEKILIDNPQSHIAKVGEVYDLTFNTISVPFLSDIQMAAIRKSVNANPKFKVVDASSGNGQFTLRIQIVQNPFPIALAVTSITTAIVGLFIFLSIAKVEQIINTPEGKTNNVVASLGIAAAVIGVSAFLVKGN